MKIITSIGLILLLVFNCCTSCNNRIKIADAIVCIENFIDKMVQQPEYTHVRNDFINYLNENQIIKNEYGTDTLEYIVDSLILFDKPKKFACLFLIVLSPSHSKSDYVTKYNGRYENDSWRFSKGMTFIYKKELIQKKYKSHGFDFLSMETRLEFFEDGFIVNKNCEVNWEYINKWKE